jgi:hypothetical protein
MASGHAAACATRVFHDGRTDAGGRFYGYWTGQVSPYHLRSTIDDEAVCQIDISGSQPTLLSALLGVKLNNTSEPEAWYDVYTELTGLAFWGVEGPTFDGNDWSDWEHQLKRPRNIAKGIIMEVIGTGNVSKLRPSDALVEKTGVTQAEWDYFLGRLVETIPALKLLEPRYDSSGCLSGYINGPGFLSFHESEMVLETIETLHSMDIPSYPMHDCLILKESDARIGIRVFKEVVSNYCYTLGGLEISVPVTVEASKGKVVYKDLDFIHNRGEYTIQGIA